MKSLVLTALMVLGSFVSMYAQSSISGRVVLEDGAAAVGVNVLVEGSQKGTVTNSDGYFALNSLMQGTYTLRFSLVGYFTEERLVELDIDENLTIDTIDLRVNARQMEELYIEGQRVQNFKSNNLSSSLRLNASLLETPQNIQVITERMLSEQSTVDMLENVTRNVSGAQMIEHWGSFARINMRGFKIPAFRNGMNVEMPWGPLTEDLSMVERIEFVKGPSGFMMSAGEPGGLYNVVTKKPQGSNKKSINIMAGSYNTVYAALDVDGKLSQDGKLLYRVNVMGRRNQTHRDFEYNERYTFAPSVRYLIDENTTLTAEYAYQYSEMAALGSAYNFSSEGIGVLPRDFSILEQNIAPSEMEEKSAFLNFKHAFTPDWSITAQLGYINYSQVANSMWVDSVTAAGIYRSVGTFDAESENVMGQVFIQGEAQTGEVSHSVLAGLDMGKKEYIADWFQSAPLGGALSYTDPVYGISPFTDFDRTAPLRERAFGPYAALIDQEYTSFYAQDELGFFNDQLLLTLAGRYTTIRSSQYGAVISQDNFSPRAALTYLFDDNTSAYVLYDQSFVPQNGRDFDGNRFDPQEGNNYEFGIKKSWDGNWNSTFALYRMNKDNMLTADPEHNNFSVQLGQVRAQGFEFDIQGEITTGLSLVLNYANTDVKLTKDTNPELEGQRIAGHARHMTNGWLSYKFNTPVLKGFGVALGYQYQVDRSSWAWGAENDSFLPDYFRLDGAINYSADKYTIGLTINNITDEYNYSGSQSGNFYYWQSEPGTNFRINLKYNFR